MPDTELSIISVAGRISLVPDFAFYKNNGDIANRIRAELGTTVGQIEIDNEHDIEIQTGQGSFYVTPNGVVSGGWITDTSKLSERQELSDFAQLMESIARCKGSFAIVSYGVRLFRRFTPENGLGLIRSHGFNNGLQSLLGEKTPSEVQSLKFSARYEREKFSDSIELEASEKDVQLRYSRDGAGTDFESYRTFLEACNLPGLIEDLTPFYNILKAAEPQTRPYRGLKGVLREMK